MKILVISNYFPPHFKGGYELSCKEVSDYLHQQGEEIMVLSGDYKKNEEEGRRDYRVVRKLTYIDYLSNDYWNKSKVEKQNYESTLRVLDRFKPDFVYFWNQQYISLGPYWAVKKKKIPHLFDIGDIWPTKYYRQGFRARLKGSVKRLLPFFIDSKMVIDPVIILSNWMKPLFKEKFYSKKIYTIPRGVTIKEGIEINSNIKEARFMFAGRIEPLKGLELIINVLAKLKEYQWKLDIYGDGEEEYISKIKFLIKEKLLEDRITLMGQVFPLDLAYQTHDIFLFPTLAQEGFGRVAIEAMSYGLPVITVNSYGPDDIVQDGINGFKCSPDKMDCWENSLKQILSDPALLIKMSQNALIRVEENYNIEKINKQRYEIIKELYYTK